MAGGLCFMISGHMCYGVEKDRLMIRVFPDRYDAFLKKPHAREMDFASTLLKGILWKLKPPS